MEKDSGVLWVSTSQDSSTVQFHSGMWFCCCLQKEKKSHACETFYLMTASWHSVISICKNIRTLLTKQSGCKWKSEMWKKSFCYIYIVYKTVIQILFTLCNGCLFLPLVFKSKKRTVTSITGIILAVNYAVSLFFLYKCVKDVRVIFFFNSFSLHQTEF